MPGGPDYPLDTSKRFTLEDAKNIRTPRARTEVEGIIHAPSGDVNNWVTAQSAAHAIRELIRVLAYLDVADLVQDRLTSAVAGVTNAVGRLESVSVDSRPHSRTSRGSCSNWSVSSGFSCRRG